MFDRETLVSTRERAAVLALMARRKLAWNRLAGSIEECGSALRLLEDLEEANDPRLGVAKWRTGEKDQALGNGL